jgi:hypothetical protein
MSAELKPGTTSAIRPLRTSSLSVRLGSSTTFLVRYTWRLFEVRLTHRPDFCLFAPATANETISDTEGVEVAWCTQPGHGTRIIPPGTFSGIQVLNTTQYRQIVAFTNQVNIDLTPTDYGGELDPRGQDMVRRL